MMQSSGTARGQQESQERMMRRTTGVMTDEEQQQQQHRTIISRDQAAVLSLSLSSGDLTQPALRQDM